MTACPMVTAQTKWGDLKETLTEQYELKRRRRMPTLTALNGSCRYFTKHTRLGGTRGMERGGFGQHSIFVYETEHECKY